MLDDLFSAARADGPVPSGDLMARIMADAEAQIAVAQAAPVPARRRGWRAALAALGGWGAVAGLGAATFAGLSIGIYMPDPLNDLAQNVLGTPYWDYSTIDMTASFYDLAEEG
ncbi:dihydroorotate dehydrogenase [Aliiroseovarius sp. PTFE2010]|uniref:dihydroorotate dehydrogenase n=1 Tax=Aliiroseovarius sp. PTFE2010 TaxID=3417190 RepID=UPI003CED7073